MRGSRDLPQAEKSLLRQHLQCLPPAEPLNRLETQSAIQSLMLKSVLLHAGISVGEDGCVTSMS